MSFLKASENKLKLFRKSKSKIKYFKRILTYQAENSSENSKNFIYEITITSIKSKKENHT